MAIQDSERLRQLVSDYYHGLITQDSYREQRAKLLDNIGAGNVEQPDTVTRKQQPAPEEFAETQPLSVSLEENSDSDSGSGSGFRPRSLVLGAVVLGGISVAAYLIFVQDIETDVQTEVIEERSSKFGDSLVEDFLSRNDWSVDSLSNFLLAWSSLDDAERQQSSEGRHYRRLRIRLHQRIGEETVLEDAVSNGQLRALTDFAAKIGAPYRESRVVATDEVVPPDVVPGVDVQDETDIVGTDSDVIGEPVAEAEFVEDKTSLADAIETPVDDAATQPDPTPSSAPEDAAVTDDPCSAEKAKTRQPYCQDNLRDGTVGPRLVVLPTGTYEMGSDDFDSESPPHQVDIAYNFAMSRHEITAAEYEQFCAATNSVCAENEGDRYYPVVSVSWDDAVLYTEWLSEATGFSYRLPSEAEWEYAARAGTESPYFFGDEITPSAAHSSENGAVDSPLSRTDRTINRNAFRLYHMSGNVREWTQDAWYPNYANAPLDGSARTSETETLKVIRGGSYADPGTKLRSAARESLDHSHNDVVTGFRVVREVLQQGAE